MDELLSVAVFRNLGDMEDLGTLAVDDSFRYFCTPSDAHLFSRLGMDGVHYCVIENYGVIQVNPAPGEERIRLVANSLNDFVSLLMVLPNAGLIYTASYQNREWFDAEMQRMMEKTALDEFWNGRVKLLRNKLASFFTIRNIKNPFQYVSQHVDIGKIQNLGAVLLP